MSAVKPLSPEEVLEKKGNDIPDVVITAVNNLLAKNLSGKKYATLLQKDIIKEIQRLDIGISKSDIYDNHWLDFESLFDKAGWKVSYDKPGYNETYEASFDFTAKEK